MAGLPSNAEPSAPQAGALRRAAAHPLVADILDEVQRNLLQLCDSDIDSVSELASYALLGGGKRLRPLVLTLVGLGLGASRESLRLITTAVEALHCATLVHDDLIDASEIRHGKPSISNRWGAAGAVLTGDLLYSRCFEIIASLEGAQLRIGLARVARELSEGELLQLHHEHDLDCPIESYLRIVDSKTASLFRFCAMAGVWQAGGSEAQVQEATRFGASFGRAYQLIDDVSDYRDSQVQTGKNSWEDLQRGRITLPLLLYCRAPGQRREAAGRLARLREAAGEGGPAGEPSSIVREIVEMVAASGALEQARAMAEGELGTATAALDRLLPPGQHKDLLQELVATAGGRLDG